MSQRVKLTVSYPPFVHYGKGIADNSYNTIIAASIPTLYGFFIYGLMSVGVVLLAISSAILWEALFCLIAKRENTVKDGNAFLIGLFLSMLLPATAPYWLVITGTFIAIVIGKEIYGGLGSNPFNPVALSYAILFVAWKDFLNFDIMLSNFSFSFNYLNPLIAVKNFGTSALNDFSLLDMFLGNHTGGIGSSSAILLIISGIYLIVRGHIRWEISLSFILGIVLTAFIFNQVAPDKYASATFNLFSGYTLIAAFFLATENTTSPVNFVAMLIYGFLGGVLTILIRNIGIYVDGSIFAILLINILTPILDRIKKVNN